MDFDLATFRTGPRLHTLRLESHAFGLDHLPFPGLRVLDLRKCKHVSGLAQGRRFFPGVDEVLITLHHFATSGSTYLDELKECHQFVRVNTLLRLGRLRVLRVWAAEQKTCTLCEDEPVGAFWRHLSLEHVGACRLEFVGFSEVEAETFSREAPTKVDDQFSFSFSFSSCSRH
jgi:hypothetical protein